MRKVLLFATLLLGTLAWARTADNGAADMQGANNDWYNQQLAAQVQQFERIADAIAPTEATSEQGGAQPGSMAAASQAANEDWYNQKLAAQVDDFIRIAAATAPSGTQ